MNVQQIILPECKIKSKKQEEYNSQYNELIRSALEQFSCICFRQPFYSPDIRDIIFDSFCKASEFSSQRSIDKYRTPLWLLRNRPVLHVFFEYKRPPHHYQYQVISERQSQIHERHSYKKRIQIF